MKPPFEPFGEIRSEPDTIEDLVDLMHALAEEAGVPVGEVAGRVREAMLAGIAVERLKLRFDIRRSSQT